MNSLKNPTSGDKQMIRQILGNLHCASSNREAIKYFMKRIGKNKDTIRNAKRSIRKAWYKSVIKLHKDQQKLYYDVMAGSL